MNFAEVGVYKGDGVRRILDMMSVGDTLWLFDSFEGHAEPGEFDTPDHPKGRYADTSEEEIRRRFPNALVIPGFIQETLFLAGNKKFKFVRVDVDHYEPTKLACEFFKSRMIPGGIIELDDFECVAGATKAIREVFGKEVIWVRDGSRPSYWISS